MSTVSECDSKVGLRADCTKFIIEIDNIFFRIISKNLNESRDIVNIYSSTEKDALIPRYVDKKIIYDETKINKFSVYLSVSELGCFRLCFVGNPGDKPEPGQKRSGDYYKGTMDYIQQTFIHIELQNFIHENYNELEINNDIEFCNFNDKNFGQYRPIFNHIQNDDRIIRLEPFSKYAFYFKCGDKKTTFDNLKEFSNSLEQKYTCEIKNIKPIFYHIVKTEEDEYTLQFYKIILTEKDTNNNIVLYYYIVNIQQFRSKQISSETRQQIIYLPIFLTTEEGDKITKFGTFNKYILAGNYICKLFDYKIQCSDINEDLCFGNYVLIGDKYDTIFPFNKIKDFNIFDKKK